MSDERSIARGNARGTRPAEAYRKNSPIILIPRPLPTSSSMYLHRNCISSRNNTIKKVITNGPRKDLITNLCRRFTTLAYNSKLQNVYKARIFLGAEKQLKAYYML
jgi:hypothetical protein